MPVGLRGTRLYGFTGATVVLVTVVFTLYWPAIDAPFVFDDSAAILDNASIRRLTPLIGTTDNPGLLCPPPPKFSARRPSAGQRHLRPELSL